MSYPGNHLPPLATSAQPNTDTPLLTPNHGSAPYAVIHAHHAPPHVPENHNHAPPLNNIAPPSTHLSSSHHQSSHTCSQLPHSPVLEQPSLEGPTDLTLTVPAKCGFLSTVLENNGVNPVTHEHIEHAQQTHAVDNVKNGFALIPIPNLPIEGSSVEIHAKKAYSNVLDAGLREVLQQQKTSHSNVIYVDDNARKICGSYPMSNANNNNQNGAPVERCSSVGVSELQEVEDASLIVLENISPTVQSNGTNTGCSSEAEKTGNFPNAAMTAPKVVEHPPTQLTTIAMRKLLQRSMKEKNSIAVVQEKGSTSNNYSSSSREQVNKDSDLPGFIVGSTVSSQKTPSFGPQNSPGSNNSPISSEENNEHPASSSDTIVACSVLSNKEKNQTSSTSKIVTYSSSKTTAESSHSQLKNKLSPLTSRFWGDDEEGEPLENWEAAADSNFQIATGQNLQCIVLEQDSGSSTLGALTASPNTTNTTNSEGNPISPFGPSLGSEYQPSTLTTNAQAYLKESEYIDVNRPISNKQKRKQAKQVEEDRLEISLVLQFLGLLTVVVQMKPRTT
ncbi:hypothetical protein LguiB_026781 [Lonicera macranthoides]